MQVRLLSQILTLCLCANALASELCWRRFGTVPEIRARFKRDFATNYPIFSQGRTDPGQEGFYLWTVPGKSGEPSASLSFDVDRNEGIIQIHMATGSPDLPGAATYLKSRLAEAYPSYRIRSEFIGTNRETLEAALANAVKSGKPLGEADFSRVPSLRAIDAPFRIEVKWFEKLEQPAYFVEQQLPTGQSGNHDGSQRVWTNWEEAAADQRFLNWLKNSPPTAPSPAGKKIYNSGHLESLFKPFRAVQIY